MIRHHRGPSCCPSLGCIPQRLDWKVQEAFYHGMELVLSSSSLLLPLSPLLLLFPPPPSSSPPSPLFFLPLFSSSPSSSPSLLPPPFLLLPVFSFPTSFLLPFPTPSSSSCLAALNFFLHSVAASGLSEVLHGTSFPEARGWNL